MENEEEIKRISQEGQKEGGRAWKSFYLGIIVAAAVIILTAVGLFVYRAIYNLAADDLTIKVVKTIHLPAGFVASSPISYYDFIEDVKAVNLFYKANAQTETGATAPVITEVQKSVWDRLVRNKILEKIARVNKIEVTAEEVDAEFNKFIKEVGSEAKAFQMIKDNYGWTPAQFKEKIIKFYLLQAKLTTAEDLVKKFEEKAKKQAEEILAKVKEGQRSFEDLAKEFSADGSAAKGGDLGWFGKGTMVKEFEEATIKLQPGQVSDLVKTRFGYHIIKLEEKKTEKGTEKWHARHILVIFPDFEKYLEEQIKNEKVWPWIKI